MYAMFKMGATRLSDFLNSLPLFVAPFILAMYSLVSAYVFKFSIPRSGISFDYIVFTVVVVVSLAIGGAI